MKLQDGDVFHRVPEIFIRGTSLKVFRVAPEVGLFTFGLILFNILQAVEKLKEENKNMRQNQKQNKQYKKQLNKGAAGGPPMKRKAEDGSDIPNKAGRGQGGNRGRGRGR